MSSEQSQLRLGFRRFADFGPPEPAPGYGLRTFRRGDENAWIGILNTGDFGLWDRARLGRLLDGERARLAPEGIFFATREDRPVGTACILLHPAEDRDTPELGWVAVHSQHRRRGLGDALCRAALGYARDLEHDYVYLMTEDFRLAAIAMYLRLGFEPEIQDPTQPARWAALRRSLTLGDEEDRPGG